MFFKRLQFILGTQQRIVSWRERWEFPLFHSGWRAVHCTDLATGKLPVSVIRVHFAMETNNYKYMPWKNVSELGWIITHFGLWRRNHRIFKIWDFQKSLPKNTAHPLYEVLYSYTARFMIHVVCLQMTFFVLDACIAAIALQHGEGTNHRSNLLRLIYIRKNACNHFFATTFTLRCRNPGK